MEKPFLNQLVVAGLKVQACPTKKRASMSGKIIEPIQDGARQSQGKLVHTINHRIQPQPQPATERYTFSGPILFSGNFPRDPCFLASGSVGCLETSHLGQLPC